MLKGAQRRTVQTIGDLPAQRHTAKELAVFVQRPAVKVQDAQVLAHGLVPSGVLGQLPLESAIRLVRRGVDANRGLPYLLDEEVALLRLGLEAGKRALRVL